MLVLDEEQTRAALPWPELIEAIARMFQSECVMPVRHHHEMEVPDEESATLLLMPAWVPGRYAGVKTVSVFQAICGGACRRSSEPIFFLPAPLGKCLLQSTAAS